MICSNASGWLLSIHKSLRLLFPYDKAFQYSWVHSRSELLDNYKPIEIMIEKGVIGIATICSAFGFFARSIMFAEELFDDLTDDPEEQKYAVQAEIEVKKMLSPPIRL